MQFGKKLMRDVLVLIVSMVGTAQAEKSVFIISKHSSPSQAQAYSIDGNQITLQANVDIHTYNQGYGTVGNAVWPDKGLMFVTYESSPMVVWASTKTLEKVGEFNTGISNCAGIVVDEDKAKIYIIHRATEDLYVFSLDDANNTLVLDGQYDLETSSSYIDAWGLALDEDKDLLYVSDGTHTVHYYDTNDWSLEDSIDIVVNSVERHAIGIAVDATRGYLYTGDWQDHNYLVRTLTAFPYTSIQVEITKTGYPSKQLIGVDVDEETGLVYCTTYHNDFRVYDVCDSNLVLKDTEVNDIDGPAGVAVGPRYKPPLFYLEKVDVNEPNSVLPGDYITYEITYGPNGVDHNNVVLTDYLPYEVQYLSSDPCGTYNPDNHTVTWDLNDLDANDPCGSVTLTVKVNDCIPGCGTITSFCEAESDSTYNTAEASTPVCSASNPEPTCTCGAIVVDVGEFNLTWCPGLFAADVDGHEVYFGSNFNDVNDANNSWPIGGVYKGQVTDPCYTLQFNSLDLHTTYYWRIDEVNDPNVWRGGVWSFMTGNYFVVEDFDSYANNEALKAVWNDYWVNGSRAEVFRETSIAHDGNSMRYSYDNDFAPYYSEADADVGDLPSQIGSDWTAGASGVKALVLYFYGQSDNDANEQMYVRLHDTDSNAVVTYGDYNDDPNDLRLEQWQEWNIDLNDFNSAGVDLTNVTRITIGFGDGVAPDGDGEGTVYFDDIQLYSRGPIPQDPHKFYIKNNSDETVVWFGNLGNLVLKGTLTENTTPDANDSIDEFRVQDSSGADVAIIDMTNGNMYIVGLLYDECGWVAPSSDNDFIIKDSSGDAVAYISDSGNVYLRGGLYPNSDP